MEAIQNGAKLVKLPEVERALQILAKYGLGACVPHMHDDDDQFASLPTDTVQVEERGRITFQNKNELDASYIPVAWRWDGDSCVIAVIAVCKGGDPCRLSREPQVANSSITG